jgi:hypothetical protein
MLFILYDLNSSASQQLSFIAVDRILAGWGEGLVKVMDE